MTAVAIPTTPPVGEPLPEGSERLHLMAATLRAHRTSTDYFRRNGASGWWCTCGTDGPRTFPSGLAADDAAAVHQAEAVEESLRLGAVWLGDGAEPVVPPLGGVAA